MLYATQIQEDQAREYLLNPELYPSLPKRKAADRKLLLWVLPSFEPYASWSLYYEQGSQKYWVRRIEWNRAKEFPSRQRPPVTVGSEGILANAIATDIIYSLKNIEIKPFFLEELVGCDGEYCGVKFGNSYCSSDIQWWCNCPEEWWELRAWFKDAAAKLDAVLPESSSRNLAWRNS